MIGSAANARTIAECAQASGYWEEAGALFITSARLVHRAFSVQMITQDESVPYKEMQRLMLGAFAGLAEVRGLPSDDSTYWQDRLSEVVAALLGPAAAFPHDGLEMITAHLSLARVAQVLSEVPYRSDADVHPMKVAHYYLGGPARVHAALAHVELLGQHSQSALDRLEAILSTEISPREDLFYALMLGLAASRKAENMDLYHEWLGRLTSEIDRAREEYKSVEGRLFAMQTLFHDIRYAIELWSIDFHTAEDLLSVAELLKARVLLDQIQAGPADAQIAALLPTESRAAASNDTPFNEQRGLSEDEVSELRVLSFKAVHGSFGLETPNPALGFHKDMHDELSKKLLDAEGALTGLSGALQKSGSPASVTEIQKSLGADELLVEYLIPRDPFSPNRETWILAVSSTDVKSRGIYIQPQGHWQTTDRSGELVERGPLSDLVARARAAIVTGDDAEAREVLRPLFEYLVRPVIEMGHQPEAYRRWIIVAHGPLHLLPMHALVDETGRHLIERVALTTVPSASVWLQMLPTHRDPPRTALAVGNPASAPALKLRSLEAAELEANKLPEILGSQVSCEVLTGPDATEGRVKRALRSADLVHFACHGELDLRDPMSGHRIILATDDLEDGRLLAREVRHIALSRPRIVTLNICEGAVCRYGPGDEPLGLLASFLIGGCENVLGGLWELHDEPAKEFILAFYRTLKTEDASQARRTVATWAISEEWPIVTWAGFELIGTGRSVGLN